MAKINIIFGILSVLLLANVSLAEVELAVAPENETIFVIQGGTINYTVTVNLTGVLDYPPQEEVFSIEEPDKQPGWNYIFYPENVTLTNDGDSNISVLTMKIPINAAVGLYNHTVIATGYDALGREINVWIELDTFVINTVVYPIPELSTAILTPAGLLGMLLVSRKFRKN